jgi:hypothetical protein
MNVEPPKSNLYNSPKIQCAEYTRPDGSKSFARINIPNKNANTRRLVRERLLAAIPVYTPETFASSAPDGIYTWIVSDKGFFATPVYSIFEHGTLHSNLTDRTGATRVHSAGEAKKTGSQLALNLLSGTYTRHILEAAENHESAEKAMESDMIALFTSIGFRDVRVVASKKTYITGLPTESELRMYAAAGYDVYLYKTKDACQGVKRPVTQHRLDTVSKQLAQPVFASLQEKLGAEKAKLESELAALDADVPVRLTSGGGGRRRSTRRLRQQSKRTRRSNR